VQIYVNAADGTPYYQQVANQVKFLVASGRLEADEKLPSVRKLAEQLMINPNTVARAYRELESEGVVQTRRGSGVFVAEGGSPLSRKEKNRILGERIETLLTEAHQLDVSLDVLINMLKQGHLKYQQGNHQPKGDQA
jgi:GntR family transcriptional regulator